MEILNFGQLSLASQQDRPTLCYVVMRSNKIKRIGTIPPCDYTVTRHNGGYGYINLPPEYELGRTVTWRTYYNVMQSSLGLDILYLGISKEETLGKVKEQLENEDEGLVDEIKYLKKSHREITNSLKTIQAELKYGNE